MTGNWQKDVKETHTQIIFNKLTEEADINGNLIEFISQLSSKMFYEFDDTPFKYKMVNEEKKFNTKELLEHLNKFNYIQKHINNIDEYINGEAAVGFEEFILEYKTKDYIYDHGICGAIIYLYNFDFYQKMIKKLFSKTSKNFISTLCWNVDSTKYENKLINDYDYIVYAVFKSVFCHNLYPDIIKETFQSNNKDWKYDFYKEPSTYFAMLVDALQVWNRDKYYKHSQLTWWPSFSSDDYDIVIEKNKIVLNIKGYGDNLGNNKKKFIDDNMAYLKDFSSLVAVNIKN